MRLTTNKKNKGQIEEILECHLYKGFLCRPENLLNQKHLSFVSPTSTTATYSLNYFFFYIVFTAVLPYLSNAKK